MSKKLALGALVVAGLASVGLFLQSKARPEPFGAEFERALDRALVSPELDALPPGRAASLRARIESTRAALELERASRAERD